MAIAAIAMISCSDDSTSGQGTGGQGSQPKTEPATQVYIQGNKTAATRAAAAKVNKKRAYFFIRLDNRIAGAEDCKSGDYFPSVFEFAVSIGLVSAGCLVYGIIVENFNVLGNERATQHHILQKTDLL